MTAEDVDETTPLLDGRYRLRDCVGEGGMARVYRADDIMLGRTVAIKLIRPGVEGGSTDRARSEMTVLASLNHPSLVTLYDARLVPGQPEYLAMEFVDGPTLGARLSSGALPPEFVAHLAAELAEALHVVHKAGIVHRDIKPSNVLLSPAQLPGARPRAKLADFGIAYLLDTSRLTSPGLVIGTVAYLSPEQIRGGEPAPASDIYSLGLVLLEALTGERVHPPGTGIAAALARLESPPRIPASLDPRWSELLTRMLDVEPTRRPAAAEVAAAAKRLTERAPAASVPIPATGVTAPLTAPTLVAPAPGIGATSAAAGAVAPTAIYPQAVPVATAPRGRNRRRRLLATVGGALAAVAVTVAAIVGVSALNAQPTPEPVTTVPSETDPSQAPPAEEDTGTDVVDDPGLTEEERKAAERAQKKAEEEAKKLEEERRKQAEEEQKKREEQQEDD
ncbi:MULTISPECIES: serine/threonine-protein kinase [Microbacterium]|uniref:serine/threonine-protein kinase n=1 Tax=Microbacterium TaxID=33882 RepID=UPI00146D6772|nr:MULTISPECIES: serine/threonine-protein kinase [Microbacterium]